MESKNSRRPLSVVLPAAGLLATAPAVGSAPPSFSARYCCVLYTASAPRRVALLPERPHRCCPPASVATLTHTFPLLRLEPLQTGRARPP